jgi:hypothetical protein
MKAEELAATLHPLEIRVFEALGNKDSFSDREICKSGVVTESQVRTVVEWQLAKGCMQVTGSAEERWVELTDLGKKYLEGTPEGRLVAEVKKKGSVAVSELMSLPGIEDHEAGSALGALKKAGILTDAAPGQIKLADSPDLEPVEAMGRLIRRVGDAGRIDLEMLAGEDVERVEKASRKRGKSKGVFRVGADVTRQLKLTPLGIDVREAARRDLEEKEVQALQPGYQPPQKSGRPAASLPGVSGLRPAQAYRARFRGDARRTGGDRVLEHGRPVHAPVPLRPGHP